MIKVHISEDLHPCPFSVSGKEDKLHSNTRNKTRDPDWAQPVVTEQIPPEGN